MPEDTGTASNHAALDDLTRGRITNAITNTLGTMKLPQAEDTATAAILISYRVTVEDEIDMQTYNTSYGYRGYGYRGTGFGFGTTQTVVNTYKRGSIIFDMYDPKKKELVWRGVTGKRLNDNHTPEQRTQMINEMVFNILAKFPPPKK